MSTYCSALFYVQQRLIVKELWDIHIKVTLKSEFTIAVFIINNLSMHIFIKTSCALVNFNQNNFLSFVQGHLFSDDVYALPVPIDKTSPT